MFENFFYCGNLFLWAAVIWAIFFGCRSVFIFVRMNEGPEGKTERIPRFHDFKWDYWIYQIFFNASGAFLGWLVLWYLNEKRFQVSSLGDLAALIIAFLGITGNLPYAARMGRLPGK